MFVEVIFSGPFNISDPHYCVTTNLIDYSLFGTLEKRSTMVLAFVHEQFISSEEGKTKMFL